MSQEFGDIHDELRAVAGDLLTKDRPAPIDVDWSLLVQAGWTGLEVPEDCDGSGATFRETAILCHEMGRAASRSGYLGGVVLPVGLLNALSDSEARSLLTGVAAGSLRVAAVFGDGGALAADPAFTVRDGRVHGSAAFVPDAHGAHRLLLLATDGSEPVVVAVGADELEVQPQPVLDETRHFARVTANGAAVEHTWRVPDPRWLWQRAAVAIACDSVGLSEAMLSATVSYAGIRQQFGRPIGSFQAVKHACADMLVQITMARQLVTAAVDAVAEGSADAAVEVSRAKAYACGTAVDIAGKAMQLHGGIGYTWESGIHVYLKRAALNRSLFGSPAAHRQHLAARIVERQQGV